MPERFFYEGTRVLKNKRGLRTQQELDKWERLVSLEKLASCQLSNFTADLAGLKRIHQYLFDDVYEWAGRTRAEKITIDGETFVPAPERLARAGIMFASSEMSAPHGELDRFLTSRWNELQRIRQNGTYTRQHWARITAAQIGMICKAHPFREGNGRTMRKFIDHSAALFHEDVDTSYPPEEWKMACGKATDEDEYDALFRLIFRFKTNMP